MDFKTLPDIQSQTLQNPFSGLAWVGMEKIQMPILWEGQSLPAHVRAQVNLREGQSRGIHMSRLYSLLSKSLSSEELSWSLLEKLAENFVTSQEGLSDAALLTVEFELPLIRKALKSGLPGWRLYPVQMEVCILGNQIQRNLKTEILYSSTCPQSTALSAELWKSSLKEQFQNSENLSVQDVNDWIDSFHGMPATPHAQRSKADVTIMLTNLMGSEVFGAQELIEGLEKVLETPVQTVVKRVDEQEFARLNGQHPMFCEDASRKVQDWLNSLEFVKAYRGVFEHQESLHAHNAVAVIEKKIPPSNN